MGAALYGPVESQLNGVIVVAGEVEQAADLADGQRDQASAGSGLGVQWSNALRWQVQKAARSWLVVKHTNGSREQDSTMWKE